MFTKRWLELPSRYSTYDPRTSITETAVQKRPSRIFRVLREGRKAFVSKQVLLAQQYREEFDKQQAGLQVGRDSRRIDQINDREMR